MKKAEKQARGDPCTTCCADCCEDIFGKGTGDSAVCAVTCVFADPTQPVDPTEFEPRAPADIEIPDILKPIIDPIRRAIDPIITELRPRIIRLGCGHTIPVGCPAPEGCCCILKITPLPPSIKLCCKGTTYKEAEEGCGDTSTE